MGTVIICQHEVGCPYREKGYCTKQYLIIDENAHCSARWYKGQPVSLDMGDEPRNNIEEVEV